VEIVIQIVHKAVEIVQVVLVETTVAVVALPAQVADVIALKT